MYSLCCISNSLSEQGHKFQTMTWARFSSYPVKKLLLLYLLAHSTTSVLHTKSFEQCASEGWGYRVSSNLFPLLTYDVAELKLEDYPDYIDIEAALADCASIIKTSASVFLVIPTSSMSLPARANTMLLKPSKNSIIMVGSWICLVRPATTVRPSISISTTPRATLLTFAARFMSKNEDKGLAKCDDSSQMFSLVLL